MTDTLRVRYHQSVADICKATLDEMAQTGPTPAHTAARNDQIVVSLMGIAGTMGLGFLLVEAIAIADADFGMPEARWAGAGIGLILGLYIHRHQFSDRGWFREHARQVGFAIRAQYPPALDTPVEVRVTDDAFEYEAPNVLVRWRWPAVETILELDWADVIRAYEQRQVVVPHTAWDRPEDREAFLDAIRQNRDAAGGHDAIVDLYLKHHDTDCPGCAYQLRATSGSRCPECGEKVTLDAVGGAFRSSLPDPDLSRF